MPEPTDPIPPQITFFERQVNVAKNELVKMDAITERLGVEIQTINQKIMSLSSDEDVDDLRDAISRAKAYTYQIQSQFEVFAQAMHDVDALLATSMHDVKVLEEVRDAQTASIAKMKAQTEAAAIANALSEKAIGQFKNN